MGIEDIFSGAVTEEPETVQVEAAPEIVEAPELVEPEVQIEPETLVEEPKTVPLATFLDQRDELKEYKRKVAEYEAPKPQDPAKVPDPYDDPSGFAAHNQQVLNQALTNQKFEMSDVIARQIHGAADVDSATEWATEKAKADPGFAMRYMREAHPIDWIVRQHKRDGLVSKLPEDVSDLDEYVKRRAEELGLIAKAAAPAVVTTQQAPVTPARSIAATSSSHGGVKDIAIGPLSALEAVFNR